MENKRLALFDFDKTIVKLDSVVGLKNYMKSNGYDIKDYDLSQLNGYVPKDAINLLNKVSWISPIKGMATHQFKDIIKAFVKENVVNNIIDEVYQKLLQLQREGVTIVLISASYRPILEVFCEEVGLDNVHIICTELDTNEDLYTGEFEGINCSGISKLIKLKAEFDLNSYDLDNSYGFTDHISDLSFLSIVGKRFVVHMENTRDDWSFLLKPAYIKTT